MVDPHEVLQLVETQFARWLSLDPDGGTRFVAGRAFDENRLIILFRWMRHPDVFGAVYELAEYGSLHGRSDAAFLAGNIVSNDLAGPPGRGTVLEVDWADGLVPDPEQIRWVGAAAESS